MSTSIECCRAVVEKFEKYYLLESKEAEIVRIMAHKAARRCFGMLESIDCMH
jgi:hypothetical protein